MTIVLVAALAAPYLATNDPATQHRDHLLAPPMPLRFVDAGGHLTWPFVYPVRVADRLERRFEEDRTRRIPLRFFRNGVLLRVENDDNGPWLPLGADRLGRDEWSRLVYGARLSLAVAGVAVAGAIAPGTAGGRVRGYGRRDCRRRVDAARRAGAHAARALRGARRARGAAARAPPDRGVPAGHVRPGRARLARGRARRARDRRDRGARASTRWRRAPPAPDRSRWCGVT